MKKLPILLLLLACAAIAFAAPVMDIVESAGTVQVTCSYQQESEVNRYTQQTFAIPAQSVSVDIQSMQIGIYNAEGQRIDEYQEIQTERVQVVKQFTFREMRGFTVRIETSREEDGMESRIDNLSYSLHSRGSFTPSQTVSEAFAPLYKEAALNYETSYLRHASYQKPSILIIAHTALVDMMEPYVSWKKALGFDVAVETIENISDNSIQIQAWIENYYQNASNPPEYLILFGDVVGSFGIPSFYISSENDVTDLPYTLIDGEDYMPEMMAGRFSFQDAGDMLTLLAKTMSFESAPYMESTAWMNRALVVAGNYGEGVVPVTPVLMSKWLVDKFYANGYAEVDTLWYPPHSDGVQFISSSINEGVQYTNYRGWGASNGWHYPRFHTDDLGTLANGRMLNIVTSIVCNTGDFANVANGNACFGEAWMLMGTSLQPNGCVAFVGPSDLHTSTENNNAIAAGFYQGVLEENYRTFGSAVLRGKWELYDNYPNDLETGGVVEFYFHVYNILSDPSLTLWKQVPATPTISLPSQIEQGTNYLSLNLPDWDGGIITATRDGSEYTFARIDNGYAFLHIDTAETGNLTVTVSRKNAVPVVTTIPIVDSDNVGVADYSFGDVYSGTDVELSLTATNYSSTEVSGLTATLSSDSPYFVDNSSTWNFGNVTAGASATASGNFGIGADCPFHEFVEMTVNFSNGDQSKIVAVVGGLLFEVVNVTPSGDGFLSPGEQTDITIEMTNISSMNAVGVTAEVTASTDAVIVNSGSVNFGDIASGSSASVVINVTAHDDVYYGRDVRFLLNLTDTDGRTSHVYANTEIGPVDQSAPTGPDAYGYYAYDIYDTGYDVAAPTYQWHTIDPDEGGNGTVFLWTDDASETVDLPFTFRFYGQDFDEVTICSNGWLSMGETWMANFRNWNIPAALGPPNLIAAYWDDLKGLVNDETEEVADMRIVYYYDSVNEEFIVQWNDAYNQENNSSIEKFEVVLIPRMDRDGDIVFNYQIADNPDLDGNYCTVGIESDDHESGICYSYANIYPASAAPLANGLSILFTIDTPDPYVSAGNTTVPYKDVVLQQNHPNPFNPETTIEFSLPNEAEVQLEVFNIRGQKVKTLVSSPMEAGNHKVTWKGKDDSDREVGSGLYLYKLSVAGKTNVKKDASSEIVTNVLQLLRWFSSV